MVIYNLTVNVQEDIHDAWVEWMKIEHIPKMLNTGKFTKALMTKVLVTEEMGGMTYSTQFTAESKAMLQRYYVEDAEELWKESARFKGKFVAFRTELEVVSEQ